MTRSELFTTMETATFPHIRLARIWAAGMSERDADWVYDWTPGRGYGQRRPTTWAEKRALVRKQIAGAREHIRKRLEDERRAAENEREHSRELAALRQRRADLDMRPFGMAIEPERREIDQRIRAILTGRAA